MVARKYISCDFYFMVFQTFKNMYVFPLSSELSNFTKKQNPPQNEPSSNYISAKNFKGRIKVSSWWPQEAEAGMPVTGRKSDEQ